MRQNSKIRASKGIVVNVIKRAREKETKISNQDWAQFHKLTEECFVDSRYRPVCKGAISGSYVDTAVETAQTEMESYADTAVAAVTARSV